MQLSPPPKTLDQASELLPGGAYTTFRTYQRTNAVRLDDHLSRLEETAGLAGQAVSIDRAGLRQALRQAIRQAPDWPELRLFNPGHAIEAAWFLLDAMELLGDWTHRELMLGVLRQSLERGWDVECGGLFYFMDLESRPVPQLEAGMKLWWPHAEALIAALWGYRLTREEHWLVWFDRVFE